MYSELIMYCNEHNIISDDSDDKKLYTQLLKQHVYIILDHKTRY